MYFDLLTSAPGCSPNDGNGTNDVVDAAATTLVDAPESTLVDAPESTFIDAPAGDAAIDAPGADSGVDAADLDSAFIDSAFDGQSFVDSAFDAPSFVDSAFDAPNFVDAAAVDAAPVDAAFDAPVSSCAPAVTIAVVYPAGGEANATFNRDFVSLRNRNPNPIDLTGTSLQFNAGVSTGAWTVVPLTGTIPGNGFYLVKLGTAITDGGAVGADPGTPQQTAASVDINRYTGRVALVADTTPLTGAGPFTPIDLVGIGNASSYEGGSANFTGSTTAAAGRKLEGCTDTNANNLDFAQVAPVAYDSTSVASAVCTCQ